MIDNYVRDSENVIKMYLTSTGIGDAILEKNISLYVGSFQGKLLQVFVPKTLLYENEENTFNYAVSVSAIMTSDTGKKVTSKPYYLGYLKDDSLLDPQTQEMTDYIVLERVLPKEFTVYVGTTTVVINVINLDNTDDPTTLDIITSQVCYLQVQESDYADDDEEVEPSEFQTLVSRVTTLERNIDLLDNVVSLGENFVIHLTGDVLPTTEELTQQVVNVENRPPRNGDVITFTLTIEGETDKSYKYIYGASGWESWQIPAIESASNGSLGLVQGTYSTNDSDVTTTEVNIRNGKILNVYVGVDGEKQELGKIFNETIPNKYLNNEVGASKQFVRDYAMPRQFNDVDFIASTGYQDNVPTEPASGIQFTKTTDAIGDFQIFQIEKTNTAEFELSSKNGYSNTIYISASANCKVSFRLTTKYKKAGGDWNNLNIELSNIIDYEANDIQKVVFSNPFTYLGEDVVDFQNGDMIQQTLEVITQTGLSITFSVYSNEVYPSSFTLTSQYFVPSVTNENIAKILVLGVDGIIESNRVVFEVQNADDFVEFKTNQREFLLFGYLPVVGTLDDSLPVNITFGNTTYNVYTFMNGGNQPITIGDLKSVMSYNQETGYRFYPKMIFIETADVQGFVVEPSTVTASQLINVIDDTDTITISLNNNKVNLSLNAEIVNKLSKMLVTPMNSPASIELVGVGTDNMQTMIELGDDFTIENGKLNINNFGSDSSSLPIGSIFPSAIPLTDAKFHLLDGSTIAQDGVYADFVTLLKTLVSSGYNISCSQEEFNTDVGNTGNCGKFVIDDTAGTVRLPKITQHIQGLDSITNIGSSLEAGLPNIEGQAISSTLGIPKGGSGYSSGALSVYSNTSVGYLNSTSDSGETRPLGYSFDASNSNSIYGNSNTVQPPSTQYPYYIVLAGGYKSNEQVNIDNVVSDLNLLKSQMSKPAMLQYRLSTEFTIAKAETQYKLPCSDSLASPNLNGRLIPQADGSIKIGTGVKMVKVSANIQWYINYICYAYAYIYKNGRTQFYIQEQTRDSGYRAIPTYFVDVLVDVEEGDEIAIAVYSTVANNSIQRCNYTVEIVE